MSHGREICTVQGKEIFATKKEAKDTVSSLRRAGRKYARSYRCPFGEHYHVTKGLIGRKGRGDFQ
jgi:hypothetical protein